MVKELNSKNVNQSEEFPVDAYVGAAKFGVDVSKEVIDVIWKTTGMNNKPFKYSFYVDTLKASQPGGHTISLEDGDKICIRRKEKEPVDKHNKFHMTLKQPKGTWWKAVTLHLNNKYVSEIVNVHDKHHENKRITSYEDMISYYVVLSKDTAFGVHTNMYWIQNSYDLIPEYDLEIDWLKD